MNSLSLFFRNHYKFLTLTATLSCFLCTGCLSPEEIYGAQSQLAETLQSQCRHLGFQPGTRGFMECRMFYDTVVKYQHIDTSYMSYGDAYRIQQHIDYTNRVCYSYYGTSSINGSDLWACIQAKEQEQIDEEKRRIELKEEEEMRQRAISSGVREANESLYLKQRMDRERERVAQSTGKPIKKVDCHIKYRSNGYEDIICK